MSEVVEKEAVKAASRKSRKVGIVVSAKMEKTVAVEVTRTIKNARYGRFQKRSVKFLADDRVLGAKTGDVVEIEETRPLSAKKRWRVTSIITRAKGTETAAAPAVTAPEA
jgi:small subunit ribosomal protein S17